MKSFRQAAGPTAVRNLVATGRTCFLCAVMTGFMLMALPLWAQPVASVVAALPAEGRSALRLLEHLSQAEEAEKAGNLEQAAGSFEQVAQVVGDSAIPLARACALRQRLGQRDQALALCQEALTRPGVTVGDYLRTVDLILDGPQPLSEEELADADAIVGQLRADGAAGVAWAVADCKIGVKSEDPSRLGRCSQALIDAIPKDPQAVAFRFAYALAAQDSELAQDVIEGAVGILPEAALVPMRAAVETRGRDGTHWVAWLGAVFGVVAVAMTLGRLLRKRGALVLRA